MVYFDQLSRVVRVNEPPKRIISLVPSITELLVDLGLEDELVGVTKFCVHPDGLKKNKTIIGGTKNILLDKVRALKPDLVIANKEENEKHAVLELQKEIPVWVSDVHDLLGAISMIEGIGKITGRSPEAKQLVVEIMKRFDGLLPYKGTAIYLIWDNPMMAVGKDTFIADMMHWAGFENAVHSTRYPEMTKKQLKALDPAFLLLSSEPFPFDQGHVAYFQKLLGGTEVILVDGEMFSWYGSRILKAADYLRSLAN